MTNSLGKGALPDSKVDVFYDQSTRAEEILNHVLDNDLKAESNTNTNLVAVSEALQSRRFLDSDTGRIKARVLLVTTNEQVLVANSLIQKEYLDLAGLFDELHILVLLDRSGKDSFDRGANNLWLYKVHHKHWWRLPTSARKAAGEALVFNGSVRPDVIVGIDAFEAGLAAYYIADDFGRPLQLHLFENFLEPIFSTLRTGNWWRKRLANYLLKRVASVRVGTSSFKEVITKRYPKILDVDILPRFYNFVGLLDAQPTFNLHKKYQDFVFIMLAFGPLTADSHLHSLFSALRRTLLNQRIGLVVVGDGPAQNLFTEKVRLLGIERSVVFVKQLDDLTSYLKTADVLVETATSPESEIHVMQAAAAGLPLVAFATELREDLFKDGRSALLCPPGDIQGFTQKVTQFINSSALRVQFREASQTMARTRLQENPSSYYESYRDSIERVLVPTDAVNVEDFQAETATNLSSNEITTLNPNYRQA